MQCSAGSSLHLIVIKRSHFAANSGLYSGLGSFRGAEYSSGRLGTECSANHEILAHFLDRADAEEVVPDTIQVGVSVRHSGRWPGGGAGILGSFRGVVGLCRSAHDRD